jgi:hypothetical protein
MANGHFVRYGTGIVLAASILVSGGCPAWAAGPVNTVNDGRVISGGSYYNTPNGKTTFINSGPGGLWIKSGTSVRGLEVNTSGNVTNNGGTLHFLAPNSVVRIDGKVDVSGILNGSGAYLGNGGHVFIDAAYLQHAGQIFANGANGGLVQINVSSAAIAPGTRIEAKGLNGNGGVIAINADGLVNIGYLSLLDSSGRVSANYDRNVINIEGGAIQALGVLRADGIVSGGVGSHGGTIRLVSTGNTNMTLVNSALTDATQRSTSDTDPRPTVTTTEAAQWRNTVLGTQTSMDGAIVIATSDRFRPGTLLSVSGSRGPAANNNDTTVNTAARAGDGGTIILSAMKNIDNFGGQIAANGGGGLSGTSPVQGGQGGTIVALTNGGVFNVSPPGGFPSGSIGVLQANGGGGGSNSSTGGTAARNGANGGSGGLVAFSSNGITRNNGLIQANGGAGGTGGSTTSRQFNPGQGGQGGQGGLMVFSDAADPVGVNSLLEVDGGHGGTGGSALIAGIRGGSGGAGGKAGIIVSPAPGTLTRSIPAVQRDGGPGQQGFSVSNGSSPVPPAFGPSHPFTATTAENELLSHNENLILLTRQIFNGARQETLLDRGEIAVKRSVNDPLGTGSADSEMTTKEGFGSAHPFRNFLIGSSENNLNLLLNKEPVFQLRTGEINLNGMNTMTVVNDGYLTNTFEWGAGNSGTMAGGRISMLATGDIENGTGMDTAGELAGGSINLASRGSVNNFDILVTSTLNDGNGIHGGSLMLNAAHDITNFGFRLIGSNGDLIGGVERYNATGNFTNLGDITAEAFRGDTGIPTTGGNIHIRAGLKFQNGNDVFNPSTITANATQSNLGRGGYIQIRSATRDTTFGTINANGTLKNGTVRLDSI